jgi:hypothetical protein
MNEMCSCLASAPPATTVEEVEHVASDWMDALGILVLLIVVAALVYFVIYMRRACQDGMAIIYTSWGDVFVGVFLPAGGMITSVFLLMSASSDSKGAALAGVLVISASFGWYVLQNIAQAIRWNSGRMAVLVAAFRLGFFWVWAISILLIMKLINPDTERGGKVVRKTAAQLALAAAIAWGIWRFLKGFIAEPDDGIGWRDDD